MSLSWRLGQLGLVGVALGVEACSEQVDDLDASLVPGAMLEQFLLAGADGAVLHRLLRPSPARPRSRQDRWWRSSGRA